MTYGLAKEAGGVDAGVVDFFAVGLGVAAIDGVAGEVDEGGGGFELGLPGAGGFGVPGEGLDVGVGVGFGVSGEDGDVVALFGEIGGEELSEESGAAGEEDFVLRAHGFSFVSV